MQITLLLWRICIARFVGATIRDPTIRVAIMVVIVSYSFEVGVSRENISNSVSCSNHISSMVHTIGL